MSPLPRFWRDIDAAIEQAVADGCDYCRGNVEVLEVLEGPELEVVCLEKRDSRCRRIQRREV